MFWLVYARLLCVQLHAYWIKLGIRPRPLLELGTNFNIRNQRKEKKREKKHKSDYLDLAPKAQSQQRVYVAALFKQ